jgi:putative transposase
VSAEADTPPAALDSDVELGDLRRRRGQWVATELKEIATAQANAVIGLIGDPKGRSYGTQKVKLRLDGEIVEMRVPRVMLRDGTVVTPKIYQTLKGEEREEANNLILEAGVSTRQVAKLSARASPDGKPVRGTSSTATSEKQKVEHLRSLVTVLHRPLADEGIVAVMMDGTSIGGRTMMAAIGITEDGRKLILGLEEDQFETAEVCTRLVEGLVRRGLDPRVLWVTDGGGAQIAAIRKVSGALEPTIQRCVRHKWANIQEQLPADMSVRMAIQKRWHEIWEGDKSADAVLDELRAFAAGLKGSHPAAAATALRDAEELVTARRLGITGDALVTLQSTNPIEAAFQQVKHAGLWAIKKTTSWVAVRHAKYHEQRRRRAAAQLLKAEPGWKRLTNTKVLRDLRARLRPELEGPGSLGRPPKLEAVEKLTLEEAPGENNARARAVGWLSPASIEPAAALPQGRSREAVVTRLLMAVKGGPTALDVDRVEPPTGRARWFGSARALETFGLRPDQDVEVDALERVVAGQHVSTDTHVRPRVHATRDIVDDQGKPAQERVTRVGHFTVRLSASSSVSRLWHEATPERRVEIEDALLAGARSGLDNLAASSQGPGDGVAAAARWHVEYEGKGQTRPRLYAEILVVGVARDGKLMSPVSRAPYFKHKASVELKRTELAAAETAAESTFKERMPVLVTEKAPEIEPVPGIETPPAAPTPARKERARQQQLPEIDRPERGIPRQAPPAPVVEAPVVEVPPVVEAPVVEAPAVEAPPVVEAPAVEAQAPAVQPAAPSVEAPAAERLSAAGLAALNTIRADGERARARLDDARTPGEQQAARDALERARSSWRQLHHARPDLVSSIEVPEQRTGGRPPAERSQPPPQIDVVEAADLLGRHAHSLGPGRTTALSERVEVLRSWMEAKHPDPRWLQERFAEQCRDNPFARLDPTTASAELLIEMRGSAIKKDVARREARSRDTGATAVDAKLAQSDRDVLDGLRGDLDRVREEHRRGGSTRMCLADWMDKEAENAARLVALAQELKDRQVERAPDRAPEVDPPADRTLSTAGIER